MRVLKRGECGTLLRLASCCPGACPTIFESVLACVWLSLLLDRRQRAQPRVSRRCTALPQGGNQAAMHRPQAPISHASVRCQDGISIPAEYTSYVAPLTSAKLWNDAKAFKDLSHMETMYVVKVLSTQPATHVSQTACILFSKLCCGIRCMLDASWQRLLNVSRHPSMPLCLQFGVSESSGDDEITFAALIWNVCSFPIRIGLHTPMSAQLF